MHHRLIESFSGPLVQNILGVFRYLYHNFLESNNNSNIKTTFFIFFWWKSKQKYILYTLEVNLFSQSFHIGYIFWSFSYVFFGIFTSHFWNLITRSELIHNVQLSYYYSLHVLFNNDGKQNKK